MKTIPILMRATLTVFLLLLTAGILNAQTVISGLVTDGETKETLPGATVSIKGTTTGTITDMEGRYEISASSGDVV